MECLSHYLLRDPHPVIESNWIMNGCFTWIIISIFYFINDFYIMTFIAVDALKKTKLIVAQINVSSWDSRLKTPAHNGEHTETALGNEEGYGCVR